MAEGVFRLSDVVLDDTIGRSTPDVEHERAVAIFDLIEENSFEPVGHKGGPYLLNLSLVDQKLVKDYFMICESYYEAIRSSTPSRIEAIDMGRRGIHNEGSRTLMDRLNGKIVMDFDTARRLFTLVCVLYWRG